MYHGKVDSRRGRRHGTAFFDRRYQKHKFNEGGKPVRQVRRRHIHTLSFTTLRHQSHSHIICPGGPWSSSHPSQPNLMICCVVGAYSSDDTETWRVCAVLNEERCLYACKAVHALGVSTTSDMHRWLLVACEHNRAAECDCAIPNPTVCPSVCPSHAGTISKRLNISYFSSPAAAEPVILSNV